MVLLIVAAGFVLAACGAPSTDSTQGGYVSGDGQITIVPEDEREPAPDIKGKTVGGQKVDIDDWHGDIVVINLWGSWCPPCREESPALDAVARETAGNGVHFLGLSTRESPATTRAFIEKHEVSYPSLYDESGRIQVAFADSLASQAIPTTWIIDADGNVAARAMTTLTEGTLTDLIDNVGTGPDADQSEAGQSDAGQSEAGQSDAGQPEAGQSDAGQSEAAQRTENADG